MSRQRSSSAEAIIWDLPLRVFHWALVICVVVSVVSAKLGATAVHERSGLAVMGLILFRVIWGGIGSQTARFTTFVKSPAAVLAYARHLVIGQTDNQSGHSALGGYATLLLLMVCLVMAVTGSFSTDDILYDGPFAHLAPDYVNTASRIHHLTEKILFAVIAMHVLALFTYFWRLKKNLMPAMITGRRANAIGPSGRLSSSRTVLGLALMFCLIVLFQLAPLLRPSLF
ncbi:cytochrome b [SAR116 cluster alpha proteobacterium HIMB100]|nr:cytochrome b [SAR116 cluster alpha proteobacterium HIMB100]